MARLIATNDALRDARTPHQKTLQERRANELRGQIEVHVSELFGLSEENMELI